MATITVKEKSEPFAQEAFKVFDRNSSDTIQVAELYAIMKSLEETLTDAEIQDLMDRAGLAGRDEVSHEGKHNI